MVRVKGTTLIWKFERRLTSVKDQVATFFGTGFMKKECNLPNF